MHDHNYIPALIAIGCFVMFAMALSIIFFALKHQRKMHENEKRLQLIENEKQIALFKASIEAEERQKEIIARNLHDSIKPMLTMLKYSLTAHQSSFQNNTFSHESLDKDKKALDEISREIRATCHDLIPAVLNNLGLVSALEEFIDTINHSSEITASFNSEGMSANLGAISKMDQVNIYRVCQELLTNILKHSGCSQLALTGVSEAGNLRMEFFYNGNGITDHDVELLSKNGLGLNSLKSRVLILNGTLNYLKAGNGYAIKFNIPLAA